MKKIKKKKKEENDVWRNSNEKNNELLGFDNLLGNRIAMIRVYDLI